jgi:aminopeptidase N
MLALAGFLIACQPDAGDQTPSTVAEPTTSPDRHSFANSHQIVVRHLDLKLDVDFESRTLAGWVTLDLTRLVDSESLILDTRDLEILGVDSGDAGNPLQFGLGDSRDRLGRPLNITLDRDINRVRVHYRTTADASGLQWLDPAQTAGGELPFLFSQSQAIHARSWIPLQDTPRVRFTYTATINTPENLRAVMSASNDPEVERGGVYHFAMPQAIPSYLMALAVGDLDFQPMSERTGIYAEPSMLAAAVWEFEDTEAMMQRCEGLFGTYRWGRYDLLILPPSFPFGGMENPRLSFITPTVIAGDKSLVALIAHELAHSWSGNLVTNATWDDLWLNEGFTVYLEARIMEAVYGSERRAMEDVLGYQSLLADFETLSDDEQHLVLSLDDPDDAFSDVPYEKGRLMLVWLEHQFGREAFDAFLRGYFKRFEFKSLDSSEFVAYLQAELLADQSRVTLPQVQQWLDQPGLPSFAVLPQSDVLAKVTAQRQQWLQGERAAAELETDSWSVHEWLSFINNMPAVLSEKQLQELDAEFGLTESGNAEIAHSWLLLAINNRYQPAFERLDRYLTGIGRMKLIVPLYRALAAQSWGQPLAVDIYRRARPGYHPQAQSALDQILEHQARPL